MSASVSVLAAVALVPASWGTTSSPPDDAGAAGTDTAIAATSSAVTVTEPSGLSVTVNQTQDLENQAISVSWTGGTPTDSGPGEPFDTTYSENYLQIFECWSPTGPTTGAGAGPSPTQCEFGGESSAGSSAYPVQGTGFEYSRILSQSTWSNYSQVSGYTDTSTGYIVEPFDAVDGTVIGQQANYNWDNNPLDPTAFWLNPYFSYDDTNEIDFARTYADGTGQALFQVDTGLEAPGLGCGQAVDPSSSGSDTVPDCWLVIVPRGTEAQENPTGLTGVNGVVTSPLNPVAWANRIDIPLQFKPIGSSCAIGADEERIVGSELATAAVTSWQPALCAQPGAPPYNYSYVSDDQARTDLTQPSYGSAGMAVFSDPIPPAQTSASDPVVYAPLTLSGVVVGFNIERQPALESGGLDPDEEPLSGTRVEHINLTPLLVAKLLTESYLAELRDVSTDDGPGSKWAWVKNNPTSLVTDPDFLQYNPEFADLSSTAGGLDAATLVVEESSSDAATALWDWVLSDPAADAWLDGSSTGEPAGDTAMTVNPLYSTNPAIAAAAGDASPFGTPTPDSYPKSDTWCYSDPSAIVEPDGAAAEPARPLCLQDWSPYALTMQAAAQAAATANDGGKTTLDPADPPDAAWGSNGPQESGESFILSVTDSASAAQYGLQTASLSRSGDDGSSPTFVAPDEQSILAGEQAMTPSAVPGVVLPDPSTTAAGAYPLSMLTYAATTPETLDTSDRQNYATFLQYAANGGQVPGVSVGQLPPGYVPLPAALQAQALAAAATILNPPVITSSAAPAAPVTSSPGSSLIASAPTSRAPSSGAIDRASPATTAPVPRVVPIPAVTPAKLIRAHTGVFGIGALRWALVITLVVGAITALSALALTPLPWRRRRVLRPGVVTASGWSP
ncbi:MAG: hypothetical protein ABSG81_07480 [Acidimicrobiales bacterium]